MNYRQSVLEENVDISTSGTKIIDVNLDDPISRITISPKITNPNLYVAQGHPDECIPKIEIVDGSDVLVSLKGSQARALAFYNTKIVPVSAMNFFARQWSFSPIDIYFGRYLFDPELALDPKKFNNLQIKITHDLDAAMASTTTGYINVVADVFDEKEITLKGFLTSIEHYSFQNVASKIEYIDLPTDFPIKMIMTHCFSDTEAPEYNISKIKLSEAHDKKLILEGDMEDLQAYFQNLFPMWTEKIYGQALTTDRNFWITPSFERIAVLNDYSEANSVITPESTGGQKLIVSAEATASFEGIVQGRAPHGTLPILCGKQDMIEDWWDAGKYGSATLKISLQAGVDTTPTTDVVVQQLRAS